jgi:hypothetical protein
MWALLRGWRGAIQASTSREVNEVSDATDNVGGSWVVQDRIEGFVERIFAHVALAHES